ncbi:MAG: ATP-binding protein [Deltaproteobacteria bacterium]|nr:ATP-binding protein [Deltaproteobacteria bacterium]
MFEVFQTEPGFGLRFSSQEEQAAKARLACEEYIQTRGGGNPESLLTIFSELCSNAIRHGHAGNPEKIVTVELTPMGSRRWTLTVEDEGPGFNVFQLQQELNQTEKGFGRISKLAELVTFQKHGARVTVQCTLPFVPGAPITLTWEGSLARITPTGSLAEDQAGHLRTILLEASQRAESVVLDFTHVKDIDGTSLAVLSLFHKRVRETGKPQKIKLEGAPESVSSLLAAFGINFESLKK